MGKQESRDHMNQKRILYEDQDIIVCHKAAGIATQTARVGQADMVSEIANYLSRAGKNAVRSLNGSRGSQPYVGVIHRLDQPVEGVLVLAKHKKAAAMLSRQIAEDETEKYYYAIVCGQGYEKKGDLEDCLLKDGRTNTSAVVSPEVKDARLARLHYEILAEQDAPAAAGAAEDVEGYHDHEGQRSGDGIAGSEESGTGGRKLALARIRLYTGRHHQIRVQMRHAGMSLLGDYKYADAQTIRISKQLQVKEVALCAYRLSFFHPESGRRMDFRIRPEGKSFQAEEFVPYYDNDEN